MKEFEAILFEKKDKVAKITLNRPAKLNAQNIQMRCEIVEALEDADNDDNVNVIVITGAGERAFSAGADISEFTSSTTSDLIKSWGKVKSPPEVIRQILKPVIAVVNGLALGGGCEVAMACDIIIASENASFGQPEVSAGVIPGGGGTQMLTRLIGEKRAKEVIFTSRRLSGQEAFNFGLVNRLVPKDKLWETVDSIIQSLVQQSPVILRLAKAAVNRAMETTLSAGMACEKELFAECFATEDQKEAAKAFIEKRKPVYVGK